MAKSSSKTTPGRRAEGKSKAKPKRLAAQHAIDAGLVRRSLDEEVVKLAVHSNMLVRGQHEEPPVRRKRSAEELTLRLGHFLEVFERTGNKTYAAHVADVPIETVKLRLKTDPAFAEKVDAARNVAVDYLRLEALRRGHDGVLEPVFHKGELCGVIRKYSDRLMERLLEAHDPMFARKQQFLGKDGQPTNPPGVVLIPETVARDDWSAYAMQAREIQEQNVKRALDEMHDRHPLTNEG